MRPPKAFLAAAAAIAAIALSGCGSDDDDGARSSNGAGSDSGGKSSPAAFEGSGPVSIKDFLYAPEDVTVSAGDSVSFSNQDSANHTATARDGSFDTGTLGKGDSAQVTIDKPGTYAYICSFHAFMNGQITVEE